jgi:hypothetical protein
MKKITFAYWHTLSIKNEPTIDDVIVLEELVHPFALKKVKGTLMITYLRLQ